MAVQIKRLTNNQQDIVQDLIKIEEEAFGVGGLNHWGFPPFIYHGAVYIAVVDKQAVGVIEYMRDFDEQDKAYLYGLAVAKDYRGKKIGNKLLEYSLNRLKEDKINKVELTVEPDNQIAINLYQKFGFEKSDYRQGEYGVEEDRLIMELNL
ncbi:MAG: GNAT family N-acetyltransferase [Halanaerobacter sp.]